MVGNPLPLNLPQECRKAAKIFKAFVSSTGGMDRVIPTSVLRTAHGFAIFSVVKGGFIFSARAGSGIVIARVANGGWSAPSAIGTAGVGFGGQAGAEITEFIVVLNSRSAVQQFMAGGSLQLGGNMSLAVGPLGRNAEGTGALNTKGKVAAMYSYSKTKGLFGGVSVEGSVLVEREDCNVKAYGYNVAAKQLLSGSVDVPDFASGLVSVLSSLAGGTQDSDPAVLEGWRDERDPDSGRGTPTAYEFGNENPFATAGKTDRPRQKRGMSVGSWRGSSKGSDGARTPEKEGARSRANTVTAGGGSDFLRPGGNRSRSSTLTGAKRFEPPAPSPLAAGPFRGGRLAEETTPIIEKDRFDFSQARDALSSDSEHDSRISFDSFDGARPFRNDAAAKKGNGAEKSPFGSSEDDLIAFETRPGRRVNGYGPDDDLHSLSSAPGYSPPRGSPVNDRLNGPSSAGKLRKSSSPQSSRSSPQSTWAQRSERRQSPPPPRPSKPKAAEAQGDVAIALWDFKGQEEGDLSFKKGDIISITKKSDEQWWTGRVRLGRAGIFPLTHVELHLAS